MKAAQRAQIQKLLKRLEKELSGKGPREIQPIRKDEAEVRGEDDEAPLAEMDQAIVSNRNRNDSVVLARVQAALERLDEHPDDFGNCTDCGDALPLGRLKAMPYAELCVNCQATRDGPKAPPTRRKVSDFR